MLYPSMLDTPLEVRFWWLIPLGLVWRIIEDRLDRKRIREHVTQSGGRVLSICWSPFGLGWFREASDRIYEVTYETKAGKLVTVNCMTSITAGVYWASDKVPDGFPEDEPSAAECLSCGHTIAAKETRCPKCGWSYETPSADRSGTQS